MASGDRDRPTDAEKADAADRFIDALDQAHRALNIAAEILRERQPSGSYRSWPLFPFIGEDLKALIEKARDPLWAAHKRAAVQGYDCHRAASRQEANRGE